MNFRTLAFIGILCLTTAFGADEQETKLKIVFDTVVQPSGPQITGQLFIKNSEPAWPGAHVDIVMGDSPAHALVANVVVQAARWKIKDASIMPTYPADGIVTLVLSQKQWDSFLYKRDLRLFVHAAQ
jgi:hypothetical protein